MPGCAPNADPQANARSARVSTSLAGPVPATDTIVELRLEAADADHDGTISRAEFNSTAGLVLRRLFY
jgi:hypothetical protein